MKKCIVYLLFIPLLVCCNWRENDKKNSAPEGCFVVSGNYETTDSVKVRLYSPEYPYADIAEADVQDGRFIIEAKCPAPQLAILDISGEPLVLECGYIEVGFGEEGRFYRKGTPMNDALQEFIDMSVKQDINVLKLEKLLRSNIKNPVGAFILPRIMSVFDAEVLGGLASEVPAKYHTRDFKEAVKQINANIEFQKIAENTAVGKSYVNFELPDINGKKQLFSSFVDNNNYTLLDFWASWCGPCRAEMPKIKAIYEKYAPKGVAVVSLSLDSSVEDWKNGVSKLGMTWTQLCDPRAGSTEVAGAYGVSTIPHFVLIDRSGKIILRTSSPEEVEKLLEVLTKEKDV